MALPDGDPEEPDSAENAGPEDELPDLDNIGPADSEKTAPQDERQRKVGETTFELGFPEKNRLSLAIDVPRFTWSNRWPPEDNQKLRETYRKVISTVVKTTPGNVLVTMPSYQEASWASEVLMRNPQVQKKILTDSSSSDTATEQIKQAFFDGPPKVLTTSLRGTLTEGVDFDGDKLRGAVVCGVPITNTSSNLAKAIETAYDNRFDNNGFEYAFSIPAIRKTRQALGRVIRGDKDVGVRVLVDERYVRTSRGGVKQYFPDYEADEFISIAPGDLPYELETFWKSQDI
jgi:DNA excision repair protein ERCC-2